MSTIGVCVCGMRVVARARVFIFLSIERSPTVIGEFLRRRLLGLHLTDAPKYRLCVWRESEVNLLEISRKSLGHIVCDIVGDILRVTSCVWHAACDMLRVTPCV